MSALVTFAIIGVNTATWILLQGLGFDRPLIDSICRCGGMSGELMGHVAPGTMVPLGPNFACVLDGDPGWITPVTSIFIHGGRFHLIGNDLPSVLNGDENSLVHHREKPIREILAYLKEKGSDSRAGPFEDRAA